VIDLHNHVLPGLDDGPGTVAAALALAANAAAEGTTRLLATPHVDERYGLDPLLIAPAVAALSDELKRAGVAIELLTGAELSVRRMGTLDATQLDCLRLGGGPFVLLECPFQAPPSLLAPAIAELGSAGLRVILAHPERCPGLIKRPEILRALVADGALCSITAGSLTGAFGSTPQQFAYELLCEGLVHNIASDAHDHVGRPPALRAGLQAGATALKGFEPLGEWLVDAAPAAIVDGKELPPRPAAPVAIQRRRAFRLRVRR
jgi:protein-tyrosine phosphatase